MKITTLIPIIFILSSCIQSKVEIPNCVHDQTCSDEIYYGYLDKKCGENSCCLASAKYLREKNLKESKACPPGKKKNMMKCPDSLSWCE